MLVGGNEHVVRQHYCLQCVWCAATTVERPLFETIRRRRRNRVILATKPPVLRGVTSETEEVYGRQVCSRHVASSQALRVVGESPFERWTLWKRSTRDQYVAVFSIGYAESTDVKPTVAGVAVLNTKCCARACVFCQHRLRVWYRLANEYPSVSGQDSTCKRHFAGEHRSRDPGFPRRLMV